MLTSGVSIAGGIRLRNDGARAMESDLTALDPSPSQSSICAESAAEDTISCMREARNLARKKNSASDCVFAASAPGSARLLGDGIALPQKDGSMARHVTCIAPEPTV